MRVRFLATCAVTAAALVVPAAAQAASVTVWADADGTQAGSGPISSKTIYAQLQDGAGGPASILISSVKFDLPLQQMNGTAALALPAATENASCKNPVTVPTSPTDAAASPCLGDVFVWVGGNPVTDLAINYGDCTATGGVPAPPQEVGSDAYAAAQIVFTGDAALTQIFSAAHVPLPPCLGVGIDVFEATQTVRLNVSLAALAEALPSVKLSEADLTIYNVDPDGSGGAAPVLFMDNPDANNIATVDDTVTVTPCAVVVAGHNCDGTGTDITDTVRETLGGANFVGISDLPAKITYGSTVHLTGTTERGDQPSPGEVVGAWVTPLHGDLITVSDWVSATDSQGNFNVAWRAIRSGTFFVGSVLDKTMSAPHSDTYYSPDSSPFTVVAPTPSVHKTRSHKRKIHGKTYYDLTLKITVPSGLSLKVKVGSKVVTKTSHGTAITIKFKKVKAKTAVTVTDTAPDVSTGTKKFKV
jgi:hypothetical protein